MSNDKKLLIWHIATQLSLAGMFTYIAQITWFIALFWIITSLFILVAIKQHIDLLEMKRQCNIVTADELYEKCQNMKAVSKEDYDKAKDTASRIKFIGSGSDG